MENVDLSIVKTEVDIDNIKEEIQDNTFEIKIEDVILKQEVPSEWNDDTDVSTNTVKTESNISPKESRVETWSFSPNEIVLHRCEHCNMAFRTPLSLNIHLVICEKKDNCIEERNAKNEKNHYKYNKLEKLKRKMFTCVTCNSVFFVEDNFAKHICKKDKQIYKCNKCNRSFLRKSSLTNHVKIHTYVPGRAILRTLLEKEIVKTTSDNKIDIKLENSENTIMEIDARASTSKTEQLPTKRNKCQFCGLTFTRSSALISHEGIHKIIQHQLDTAESRRSIDSNVFRKSTDFICEICDTSYTSLELLKKHKITAHIEVERENMDNLNESIYEEHCYMQTVHKESDGTSQLDRHVESHSELYNCIICEKSFENEEHLEEHIKGKHVVAKYSDSGRIRFACPLCSFITRQSEFLYKHIFTHKC